MTQLHEDRILFLDLGRAVAICMMLQGHFVTAALDPQYKDFELLGYSIYAHIRGITAPLFFTITGTVFVYLLSKDLNTPFRDVSRIKKGFKRVGLLLLWAYGLQLNFTVFFQQFGSFSKEITLLTEKYNYNFVAYLLEKNGSSVYGFHVLHCISFGLLACILLFIVARKYRRIPLSLWCFIGAISIFTIDAVIRYQLEKGSYFPSWAPEIVQNMFVGKHSVFPITPYVTFVCLGGMLGAFIYSKQKAIFQYKYSLGLALIGVLIILYNYSFRESIDFVLRQTTAINDNLFLDSNSVLGRFGEVLIIIALFLFLETRGWIRNGWFLTIGKNTFPIFVIHAILLYGSTLGFGLDTIFRAIKHPTLHSPIVVAGMALLFVGLFVPFVKHIDSLDRVFQNYTRVIYFNQLKHKPTYFNYFWASLVGLIILQRLLSLIV